MCGAQSRQHCSACKKANYCSVKCQKEDWKAHKPECKRAQDNACDSRATVLKVFKVSVEPGGTSGTRDVYVEATPRAHDGALFVLLWDQEEGIPFTRISTIIDETALLPPGSMMFFMKTWGENEGLMEQLEAQRVIEVLVRKAVTVNAWGSTAALCKLILKPGEYEDATPKDGEADDAEADKAEEGMGEDDDADGEAMDEDTDAADAQGPGTRQAPGAAAATASECSTTNAASRDVVNIVELQDNASMKVRDVKVSAARARELLTHIGRVDCPLAAKLGYPLMLVPTDPGRRAIPVIHYPPVSHNPHNNRAATVLASRYNTGLAPGVVIGHVYALRTDGKDFTVREWERLDDVGMNGLMDIYSINRTPPTEAQFKRLKENVALNLAMAQRRR